MKNFKFVWRHKRSQIAKALLRKKTKAGEIRTLDFRLYYKVIVIKKVWYWHENRNIDQWNKIESPGINPHIYGYFIFEKGGKNIQKRNDRFFNKLYLLNLCVYYFSKVSDIFTVNILNYFFRKIAYL